MFKSRKNNSKKLDEEKNKWLDLLRNKYQKALDQFGLNLFNLDELNQRIDQNEAISGNFEIFLKAEMDWYNQLIEKAEEIMEDKRKRFEIHERVEAIMAQNDEKIKKYPDAFFHPHASFEIRRLVGAISQWDAQYKTYLQNYFRGTQEISILRNDLQFIERFVWVKETSLSLLLRKYIEDLSGSIPREEIERKLMQTAGESIYRIKQFLKKFLDQSPSSLLDRLDPLAKSNYTNLKKTTSLRNRLTEIYNQADRILEDFRLTSLATYGNTRNTYSKYKNGVQ